MNVSKTTPSTDCAALLKLFRITEADRKSLRALQPWFDRNMTRVVDEFYAHLQGFPDAVRIIQQSGSSIEKLKKTNPKYFLELTRGAFDDQYFQSRRIVGQIHARIGLEPKWFFGAMTTYFDEIFPALIKGARLNPKAVARTIVALQKALCLDQSMIMDAYIEGYAEAIRETGKKLNAIAEEIGASSYQLREASRVSAVTASETTASAQQLASGTAMQAESAQEISHSMDAIAVSTAGISDGIHKQNEAVKIAEEALAHVGGRITEIASLSEIWLTLRDNVEKIEQLKSSAQKSADRVQEMQKASEEIVRIVATIEDVASQTNLLALNAAIEAARAGEHGRGFSVVADEVRKLAEETASSSKEITNLIHAIQDQSNHASVAMKATVADVGEVVDLTSRSAEALEGISTASAAATSLKGELSSAMEEVYRVATHNADLIANAERQVGTVRAAVNDVVAVITENSASTAELEASTHEMGAQVEELAASVETFDELVAELRAVEKRSKQSDRMAA